MKAEFPQIGLNKGVFSIFNQLLKFFKILKKAFLGNDDSLYYLNCKNHERPFTNGLKVFCAIYLGGATLLLLISITNFSWET